MITSDWAGLAQSVERRTLNPVVVGSSPTVGATTFAQKLHLIVSSLMLALTVPFVTNLVMLLQFPVIFLVIRTSMTKKYDRKSYRFGLFFHM